MTPGGYHVVEIDGVKTGDRYWYQFGDGPGRPDPASRYQPAGVHGPSQVVSSRDFPWTDSAWRGVAKEDLIIYELHIGAFTDEGTFLAAIDRLDELVELGITAVELMPVADAAGRWNWGYDGVCLFAPNRNYGTPDNLRSLIDEAHRRGLAVILDVVYNHLGPEGNYLGESGPYLSQRHQTAWGPGPNFDDPEQGEQLRRFMVANAVYWFDEFHFDGLRVDAIHCIRDDSPRHVVSDISQAVHRWSAENRSPAMLIAESNVYDPEMITPLADGGIGFDAEWCDDLLHSVFAVLRPGEQLCHRRYEPYSDLDQTLRLGYVFEGTLRDERGRQTPAQRVDTSGLIYSIQHHDFIGNHPLGRRLHQLTSPEAQRAAATLLILLPAIPMLFMGEEFSCEHPFQFFVDFGDDHLRRAVVEGRQAEYPQHDWSSGKLPTDPETFHSSKIGPTNQGDGEMRDWYRKLIKIRKEWRKSGLLRGENLSVDNDLAQGIFRLKYSSPTQSALVIVQLASDQRAEQMISIPATGEVLLDSRQGQTVTDQLRANHAKILMDSAR